MPLIIEYGDGSLDLSIFRHCPGVVGAGPAPLQLLLTVEVSSRGVGIGHPRSVSWDRSGTTLALGTVGNAVCLVQPGEVSFERWAHPANDKRRTATQKRNSNDVQQ